MKRYVVFSGDRTYALGGACDYVMDFSKFSDAWAYRNSLLADERRGHLRWAHVWDTREHVIHPSTEEDDYGFSVGIA